MNSLPLLAEQEEPGHFAAVDDARQCVAQDKLGYGYEGNYGKPILFPIMIPFNR